MSIYDWFALNKKGIVYQTQSRSCVLIGKIVYFHTQCSKKGPKCSLRKRDFNRFLFLKQKLWLYEYFISLYFFPFVHMDWFLVFIRSMVSPLCLLLYVSVLSVSVWVGICFFWLSLFRLVRSLSMSVAVLLDFYEMNVYVCVCALAHILGIVSYRSVSQWCR